MLLSKGFKVAEVSRQIGVTEPFMPNLPYSMVAKSMVEVDQAVIVQVLSV